MAHLFKSRRRCVPSFGSLALASVRHAPAIYRNNVALTGGRGNWINQPTNFVLSNNVFVNNTTKCERDPKRGRKTFVTGDYETYAELYFTLHRPDGKYGSVVVTGNVFATGPECGAGITFAPNGTGIIVQDNVVTGGGRKVVVDPTCKDVLVRDNLGVR
jgi:hypothetical protein